MENRPNLDILKNLFPDQKKVEEQKKQQFEYWTKYNKALNVLFNTEYGEFIISALVGYCKWDSIFNYNEENRKMIQIQQEMIRELILSRLTNENLSKLLTKIRKGV